MRIPLLVRIGVLILATTGFYTYVGQMVPQKEIQPPEEIAIAADLTTAQMVTIGQQIMNGKGLCFTCHTLGQKEGPYRFPDLEGVDVRAKTREPGLSDVEYFAQAMYEPNAYIVPGFVPGMPTINKPPVGLTDQEILCVIAYLQTLGGTPTVTLQTKHHYTSGTATAPAQPGAEGTPPSGATGAGGAAGAPGAPGAPGGTGSPK